MLRLILKVVLVTEIWGMLVTCLSCQNSDHASLPLNLKTSLEFYQSVIKDQRSSHQSLGRLIKRFQKKEVRIVLVGDSITEGWDLPNVGASYGNLLSKELGKIYPDKKISVLNASLGSRTLRHFVDPHYVGYPFEPAKEQGFGSHPPMNRPWIIVGKSWLDTVRDWQPDILILAFGINDAWEENATTHFISQLETCLTLIKTWPSHPELLLVTSMLMSQESPKNDNVLSIAQVTRIFSHQHDLVLIDVNRTWIAAVHGIDLLTGHWTKKPLYNALEVLGSRDNNNGNGFNHPTMLGHQNIYFATFEPIFEALQKEH